MKRWLLVALLALCGVASGTVVINSYRFATAAYDPSTDAAVIEWLKADALGLADNDPVGTWTASTGNNATQTGAARPTFKTAIQNGKPVVRFDGSGDFMDMADLASQAQPFTVLVVFKINVATSTTYVFGPNTSAAGRDIRFGITHTDKFSAYSGNGSDLIDFATADLNWHILQLVFNGAVSTYRLDGGARATFSATPGADAFLGIMLGDYPAGGLYGSMDLGEIIVRNTGDTSAEAAIFAYLNARWAVY